MPKTQAIKSSKKKSKRDARGPSETPLTAERPETDSQQGSSEMAIDEDVPMSPRGSTEVPPDPTLDELMDGAEEVNDPESPTPASITGPATGPFTFTVPKPKAKWEDEVEDQETKAANKVKKRAAKKEKERASKQDRLTKAMEDRAAGKPPPQPCRQCGSAAHWTQDCKEPATKSKRKAESSPAKLAKAPVKKKGKLNESVLTDTLRRLSTATGDTTNISGSTSDVMTKPKGAKTHKTRRAARGQDGSGRLSDGTYIYAKLAKDFRETPPSPTDIIDALPEAGLEVALVATITNHDAKGLLIRLRSAESLELFSGKVLVVKGKQITLSPYHTGGAQVFIADRASVTPNHILAVALARTVPGYNFWLAREELRGIMLNKAVVVFDRAPNLYKFQVPTDVGKDDKAAFVVRFRAADHGSTRCEVCNSDGHNTVDCPTLVRVVLTGQSAIEPLLLTKPSVNV